jgi:hypothetical protein
MGVGDKRPTNNVTSSWQQPVKIGVGSGRRMGVSVRGVVGVDAGVEEAGMPRERTGMDGYMVGVVLYAVSRAMRETYLPARETENQGVAYLI